MPEADKTVKIDGDVSLAKITKKCEFEQKGGFQIRAIKGESKTVGNNILLFNPTEFMEKDPDEVLKKLTFVVVGNKKPDDIKKEMKQNDQTLLCDVSEIFVEKNATKVLVFGKN